MPQTWDELVATWKLSADEKKFLDNITQKAPELKDGGLRLSDYNRAMNEVSSKKKQYDEAIAYKSELDSWYEDRKPAWEKLKEAGAVDDDMNPLWPTEKERLQKELDDAKKAA